MMHPQFFINNVGNKLLPHYDRLNLLVYLDQLPEKTIEDVNCSAHIQRQFLEIDKSKYIDVKVKGMAFWKRTFYTINHDGLIYLNHYTQKCKITNYDIRKYIAELEEIPDIDTFNQQLIIYMSKRFYGVVDYVFQNAILSGVFIKLHHFFKSLHPINRSAKYILREYYENATNGIDISQYDAYKDEFNFFLLCAMVEFHGSDIFSEYFDPHKEKAEEPEIPKDHDGKTDIVVNFTD